MPRKYVKKRIRPYTQKDLAEALEKIKSGDLTQYRAAKQYKIPMTTLHDHIKESARYLRPNAGRPTVIAFEDEKKLAHAITVMEKWGFGLSRFEVMEIVADYVRVNNIRTPFRDNIPGPDWFINFRKRHGLSIKKAQPVEYVRKRMTDPFVIAEYFDLLLNTLTDLNLFESPQAIWNLDETSMSLDPSRTKVVGKINKPCARTTHGTGKENVTVLTGASASGKKLPPLIVCKGKYIWDQWMADLDPSAYDFELSYAASAKGWMETDIFYNYIENVFIPNIGQERPVLVIYDGHSTHVDVRVVQLAIQNDITILKLPPHTSHLLQPMDIAVFKSFKTAWDYKLVEWQRRNIGTKMPKKVFAQALADTWQQISPDLIKNGFKKAGIYPFNAHIIPIDKYDPDSYRRYQKKISETQPTQRILRNPDSLKNICLDFFNNVSFNYNVFKESHNADITLLSQISKYGEENLSFVALHPSEIPICLRNFKPVQSNIPKNLPSVIIKSNIIIKEATHSPLQSVPPSQLSCTFEDLVLRKIQQDKKDIIAPKKKRITKGAEVITAAIGRRIAEEIEKNKVSKQSKIKKKSDILKQNFICTTQKRNNRPGPSGVKNKNKRKRQPSLSSETSISDIMSEHSDSDIFDVIESMDEHSEESEEQKVSQKKIKGVIRCKQIKTCDNLLDKKILSNKFANPFSTKGKGIGKKSKGKENKINVKLQEKRTVESDSEDNAEMLVIGKNMTTGKYLKIPDEDKQLSLTLENNDILDETKNKEQMLKEIYKLKDTVLVRYLIRNKWKYFIGFIEKINHYDQDLYYSINYLKTMRKEQQLIFVTPKRKDSDNIPEQLIVKKINIKKDNEKEYSLLNDEDTIYFD